MIRQVSINPLTQSVFYLIHAGFFLVFEISTSSVLFFFTHEKAKYIIPVKSRTRKLKFNKMFLLLLYHERLNMVKKKYHP